MSVSLAAKLGSRERLKVRSRCGCSLCARQMRCTEPTEMPMALAIARPVQWVAWCGGAVHVKSTTRAVVSTASGALPGLRVLSRSKPSTPLSAKRCCHRHTVGRLTPILCATCCAECRSKRHAMPCHHNLEEYLTAYLDGAELHDDPKGPLFRTIGRGTDK